MSSSYHGDAVPSSSVPAASAAAAGASHHSRSSSSASEGMTVTRQNVHDMSAQLSAVLSAKASQKAPGHSGHHAHQPSLAVHYAGPAPVGHEADSLTENMERLRLQSRWTRRRGEGEEEEEKMKKKQQQGRGKPRQPLSLADSVFCFRHLFVVFDRIL